MKKQYSTSKKISLSIIKALIISLAFVMLMAVSLSSCDNSGGEWKEIGNVNVGYSSPYVENSGASNGNGYCDSCYIDIRGITADKGDENGHYVYKNAYVVLNITIDGKDYTHRVKINEDGSVSAYKAYIDLKGDTTVSKVKSGYVRVAKTEGYKKQVAHTYEIYGDPYEGDCAKGPYQAYKCTDCGGYKNEVLGEPLGHNIGDDGICSICGRDFAGETNNGDGGINYVTATYNPKLDLDISPDGIGTRTGTIEIDVGTDPTLISGWGAQSTKEHIIKINGVPEWNGKKLIVSYTVMGYGEADILVELFSNELNDDYRAEIHVNIFDD